MSYILSFLRLISISYLCTYLNYCYNHETQLVSTGENVSLFISSIQMNYPENDHVIVVLVDIGDNDDGDSNSNTYLFE